jgi:hypothetical protein
MTMAKGLPSNLICIPQPLAPIHCRIASFIVTITGKSERSAMVGKASSPG